MNPRRAKDARTFSCSKSGPTTMPSSSNPPSRPIARDVNVSASGIVSDNPMSAWYLAIGNDPDPSGASSRSRSISRLLTPSALSRPSRSAARLRSAAISARCRFPSASVKDPNATAIDKPLMAMAVRNRSSSRGLGKASTRLAECVGGIREALAANASRSTTASNRPDARRSFQKGQTSSGWPSAITKTLPLRIPGSAMAGDRRDSKSPMTAENAFQSLSDMGPTHPLNERLPPPKADIAEYPGVRMSTILALTGCAPGRAVAIAAVKAGQAAHSRQPARAQASRNRMSPGVSSECIRVEYVPLGPGSGCSIPQPRFSESTTGCSLRTRARWQTRRGSLSVSQPPDGHTSGSNIRPCARLGLGKDLGEPHDRIESRAAASWMVSCRQPLGRRVQLVPKKHGDSRSHCSEIPEIDVHVGHSAYGGR